MKWTVLWDRRAERAMLDLDRSVARRIYQKVDDAASSSDPMRFFERLTGEEEYKLRVGDYRLICNLPGKKTIIVVKVDHRKRVYER